jgi:hypothetical protein
VNFVECDRVRDRFSAFLEKELEPSEERELKAHLASCPACQEDLERFRKALDWLHGVGEVETPEGFLSEIREKIENRRMKLLSDKRASKWFPMAPSFRLPIQAATMVAIVFLSIYLAKMTPREEFFPRIAIERKAPFSPAEEKKDQVIASKETGRERALQRGAEEETRSSEFFKSKEVEPPVSVHPEGKKVEKTDVQEILPGKEEIVTKMEPRQDISQQVEIERKAPTSPAEERKDQGVPSKAAGREEIVKSDREMIVKSTDLAGTLSQIHELVRRFGGEVSKKEGNVILASLPAASFPEFERIVRGFTSSSRETETRLQKERAGGVSAVPGPMGFRAPEKGEKGPGGGPETEGRLIVRILLLY